MTPSSSNNDEEQSVGFDRIATVVLGLPLVAFVFCVIWSLLFHFEATTSTHCGVPNLLPSISAAVATRSPQKYVWRILICLHAAPRLMLAFSFKKYLQTSPMRPSRSGNSFDLLCTLQTLVELCEIFFLVLLSVVSSIEDHNLHKASFCLFALFSLLNMAMTTSLFNTSGRRRANILGETWFEYKALGACVAVLSLLTSLYLFNRHNTYCEPGVYTFFALAEYTFVLANIFFHSTRRYDFSGRRLIFTASGGGDSFVYTSLPSHHSFSIRSEKVKA